MGKNKPEKTSVPATTADKAGKSKDGKGGNGKESTAPVGKVDTKGKNKKNAEEEPEKKEERKPQTWTGKTPVTMLNEWCQKNHHPRPRFDPTPVRGHRGPDPVFKFRVTVDIDLGQNKKDRRIFIPDDASLNAQDARHVAAVVALHGLCSNLPLYRVLAPEYRELWGVLTERHKQKQEELKRQQEEEELEKKRIIEKQLKEPKHKHQMATVFMNNEARALIDSVISHIREERFRAENGENALVTAGGSADLHRSLQRMGFRPQDVENALRACSKITEALDWLCLNVLEENLPKKFGPAKGNFEVVVFNKPIAKTEKLAAKTGHEGDVNAESNDVTGATRKFVEMGFEVDECNAYARKYEVNFSNDDEALVDDNVCKMFSEMILKQKGDSVDGDSDLQEILGQEYEILESLYAPDVVRSTHMIKIDLTLPKFGKTSLEVRFHEKSRYPHEIPAIILHNKSLLPKTKRQIIEKLAEECQQIVGGEMIATMTAWLETNISSFDNASNIDEFSYEAAEIETPSVKTGGKISQQKTQRQNFVSPSASPSEMRRRESKSKPAKSESELLEISRKILEEFQKRQEVDGYVKLRKVRERLPVFACKNDFLKLFAKNQVIVLTGETGSGKTTQIPQYILESMVQSLQGAKCNIICTQPRRIAAMSVAQRVADEWSGSQEKPGGTIGYHIRHEAKASSSTRLLFCTTGILLRRLAADPNMEGVSHIVVDEVHERNMDTDFLLILLRDLLRRRSDLKAILMSATLDSRKFSGYFKGAPVFTVPGFTYPVTEYFLEEALNLTNYEPRYTVRSEGDDVADDDNTISPTGESALPVAKMDDSKIDFEFIACLIWHILGQKNASGAILVFMPGLAEILNLVDTIEYGARSQNRKCVVYPLHSSLPPNQQQAVFVRPPQGVTKIIVSTNIAETSVTIDDVTVVIDSGQSNQSQYEWANHTNRLVTGWVSKAALRQRSGRAGRTSPGKCYRLFYKARLKEMAENELPELVRAPLQQLCLQVRLLAQGYKGSIFQFLSNALDSPPQQAVTAAIEELRGLHALTADEELTPLGYHLAALPVDVYIGKLLLFGCIFRCIDPILTIAATLSHRSPFFRQQAVGGGDTTMNSFQPHGKSDLVVLWKAYDGWLNAKAAGAEKAYCNEKNLSIASLKTIADLKVQFAEILGDIGFLPYGVTRKSISQNQRGGSDGVLEATGQSHNTLSNNPKMIRAIVCAGLYPHVARVDAPQQQYTDTISGAIAVTPQARELRITTKDRERVFIHPQSVNFSQGAYESPWLMYHTKLHTSKVYLRDTTMAPPYSLLLFSFGTNISVDHMKQIIVVDDWIKFHAPARIAVLAKEIRSEFLELLNLKIQNPSYDVAASDLIDVVTKLIMSDGIL